MLITFPLTGLLVFNEEKMIVDLPEYAPFYPFAAFWLFYMAIGYLWRFYHGSENEKPYKMGSGWNNPAHRMNQQQLGKSLNGIYVSPTRR